MTPEVNSLGKRCSAVSTDEWPLAQMNCVHVLLEVRILLEELPTGDALERLLLEVDCLLGVYNLLVGCLVNDLWVD